MVGSLGDILEMLGADNGQVGTEGRNQARWQDGPPVLAALAIAHHDFVPADIDVLDAQVQGLEKAKTPAVQKACDDPVRPGQFVEQRAAFVPRQHDWDALGPLGMYEVTEPGQLATKHLAVEKQYRGQCLVLAGRAHSARMGEARQERADLGFGQAVGVAFAVKQDEPADPGDVRFFASLAVMPRAERDPNTFQQSRGLRVGAKDDIRRRHGRTARWASRGPAILAGDWTTSGRQPDGRTISRRND
jgi:hypothetical protein